VIIVTRPINLSVTVEKSTVKKILKILAISVVLGAIASVLYRYQDMILARFSPFLNRVITEITSISAPCENPIPYTLGAFAPEFGISQEYFLGALNEAEMIWEKPIGKVLFTHAAGSKKNNILKINLIYDFRQQATSKLASLGIIVKDNRATYDTLKIKFTELKTKLEIAKSDYDARVKSFVAQEEAYGKQVDYWNSQGGAPMEEYDKLQTEKKLLDTKLSELGVMQSAINEMVTEINAVVVVLNRLANILNLSVEKYNTIGATRGESFEEGVYHSDGINQEIDIYEFSSHEKLVRVLAHELGHALDLPHVEDKNAIMYELNQANDLRLTTDDLEALHLKCQ
jgi:Matrixin